MILIPGTGAFDDLAEAEEGDFFHVLGMPRVSMALVKWRCNNADEMPFVLGWDIPYEMVILEVFD